MNTVTLLTTNSPRQHLSSPDEHTAFQSELGEQSQPATCFNRLCFSPLRSVRQWLDNIEVSNSKRAKFLCKVIPGQCPFEREIQVLGYTIIRIPPLCKLNPVYEQLVGLRFRALCYLAEQN